MDKIKVFSGSVNQGLHLEVNKLLKIKPGLSSIKRFSDGESQIEILENVRGRDIFYYPISMPSFNSR